jgi:hypothetical protein
MRKETNILTNIHLLKTQLSKHFMVNPSQIKFERFKQNIDANISESYQDSNLVFTESIVGFSVNKTIKIKSFDDYCKTFIDNDYISYGQSIGNYIVNNKIDMDSYTFLCVLKCSSKKYTNVKVIMTPKFFEFINNETKNIELSTLSLDRDITNVNQLYFGSIENVPTMN